MPWNPFLRSHNEIYNNPYAADGYESSPNISNGYEKSRLRIILIIVAVSILACIGVIALITHSLSPGSKQDKYTQSATAAARKKTPNAKVSNIKVAGGFAIATVQDPTAVGQANAGNVTIFRVNKDGSMTQIANGSYFSPIDLLGFGIPLTTQAELTGKSLAQVQLSLAELCGYDGSDTPGYFGFDGSFNPGGWQIDANTLDSLEQALTGVLSKKNTEAQQGKMVICVNATRENSNFKTDSQTYISTFTLELQFITSDGTVTTHMFTFAIGPNSYRSYTLDGQNID